MIIMAESGLSLFSAAQMPTRCEGGVDCTSGGTVMGDRLSAGLVVVCHVRDCGVCVWRHLVSTRVTHAPTSGGEGEGIPFAFFVYLCFASCLRSFLLPFVFFVAFNIIPFTQPGHLSATGSLQPVLLPKYGTTSYEVVRS